MAEPTLAELMAMGANPNGVRRAPLPAPAVPAGGNNAPLTDAERAQYQALVMGQPLPATAPAVAPAETPHVPYVWGPPHGLKPGRTPFATSAPQPPVDMTDPSRPVSPAEAQKYGASKREVYLSAHGPSPAYETWDDRVAREKALGASPDAGSSVAKAAGAGAPRDIKFATPGAGGATLGGVEPPQITWGGGGGGAGQTVAAHEVPLTAPARQREVSQALAAQKAGVEDVAAANTEIGHQRAVGTTELARETKNAGNDLKARSQAARDESKAYLKHIDDFSAKIAEDRIDPNRMWNNASTGQQIAWTAAKMFGAFGQAFMHSSSNQVADHIDGLVQQDIAAQRFAHEQGEKRLNHMNSLYLHALQETNSAEEAERMATGYGLESAKQNILAMTEEAGSAKAKAEGKIAAGLIDEKIAEKGISFNKWVQEQRLGGGGLSPEKIADLARKRVEQQETLGHPTTLDDAKRWVIESEMSRTVGAGSAIGGAKAEPGSKTEKLDEARTEVQGAIGSIDRAIDSGAAFKQGPIGALWANVPGATESKIDRFEREKYRAQVKAWVGAGWKLTTNGMEPKNPAIIEELSDHFMPEAWDDAALARRKAEGLKDMLRDAGTSKGVLFNEANRDLKGLPPAYKGVGADAPPSSFSPVKK